jgi:hypothetical protein
MLVVPLYLTHPTLFEMWLTDICARGVSFTVAPRTYDYKSAELEFKFKTVLVKTLRTIFVTSLALPPNWNDVLARAIDSVCRAFLPNQVCFPHVKDRGLRAWCAQTGYHELPSGNLARRCVFE